MSTGRRVLVTVPLIHEATFRQARVLEREGLLDSLMVPLHLGWVRGLASRLPGLGAPMSRYLGPWDRGQGAASGARLAALACAAGFRFARGQHRTDRIQPLLDWRARALDRSSARAVRRRRPSAVITLERLSPRTVAAARRLGIRTVASINYDAWGVAEALRTELRRSTNSREAAEIASELEREDVLGSDRELRTAGHIMLESTRMRDRLVGLGVELEQTTVLYQGVDTTAFVPFARDYSPRPLRVAHVGRVCYAKGLPYVGEAVTLAGDAVSQFAVVGWDYGSMPGLRSRLGDAEFTGGLPASGVREQLAKADLFVLGTLADALPRAVLEAMATGLPVVVTHESGYGDIIRDGVEGFLVPARDVDAMAARLRQVSGDGELRRRMALAARARSEEYSWERYEQRFRSQLGRILGLGSLRLEAASAESD